jgi:hypothetical protein
MFSSDSHIQMKCKGQTGREAGTQNYRVLPKISDTARQPAAIPVNEKQEWRYLQ